MSLLRSLPLLLTLPALAAAGCVIHISEHDDELAPEAPDVLDVRITSRATARVLVATPFDAETGIESFVVGLVDDADGEIALEQTIASTELWGEPQWLDIAGLRPGVARYVTIAAVDYGGNRSTVRTVGPLTTDFAYSGALTPVSPEDGDNALGYQFARGDFDADGYSDVAVAAPFKSVDGTLGAGAVHIHRGSADGISARPDLVINGETAFGQLGNALTAIDWNDDDTPDLAIGVPFADSGNGAIYIYDGARLGADGALESAPDVVIESDGAGWFATAAIGFTLTTLDFDGDGRQDLATGAVAAGDTGGVLVIHGGGGWGQLTLSDSAPLLGGTAVTRLLSPSPSDLFGVALAPVSGESRADALAISGFQTGRVALLSGVEAGAAGVITDSPFSAETDLEIDATALGPEAYVGAALGSILTDDGNALVIGAYRANDGAGLVALVPAHLTGQLTLAEAATTLISGEPGDQLGSAIANNAAADHADVDGDGIEDLVIVGGSGELELLVWYGDDLPVGEASSAGAPYHLSAPIGMVGALPSIGGSPTSASWVGDIDGDGLEDLAWADWTGNDSDGLFELLR